MQLFFPESEEGAGNGLTFFEGKNVRLPNSVKVPHMGWNTLRIVKQNEILDGIKDESYVYFVHSLYPVPANKEIVCTQTDYGATFTSAIAAKNVYGTQFHPEKSGDIGLRILKNFAKLVTR
jgi:glutamine amidotransferase